MTKKYRTYVDYVSEGRVQTFQFNTIKEAKLFIEDLETKLKEDGFDFKMSMYRVEV